MLDLRPDLTEGRMIQHPNSFLMHQCLQAASVGDRHTLRALWAPDIVWHIKGANPKLGDIKGADNILDFLALMGEVGSTGIHTEVEDVMISNERAAVICHSYLQIGDRVLDADFLVIATIMSRRVQEVTTIPFDQQRVAEFWAA
jgi:ketosteroid isomerase-like protein